MDERKYWLGFSVFPGIGPKRFFLLLEKFGNAQDAWSAREKDIKEPLGAILTQKFLAFRKTFSIEDYSKKLSKSDVSFTTLLDKAYPPKLKQIDTPPFVLYYKGKLHSDDTYHQSVGVVGTRRVTGYGAEVTKVFTEGLVDAGCMIVSGLAMGVDAIAHRTTIENKGYTIAVLGCGVDCCSPRENSQLYQMIIDSGGAIVSEFPLGQAPSKGSFPSRNRIIAGLSDAVLVTEGAGDSGALITAEFAKKYGRKVFAVPGQITSSLSKGPLTLIQKGARLVTSGRDILKELNITANPPSRRLRRAKGDTKEEQKVLDLLQNESLQFDLLVSRAKIMPTQLSIVLSVLEMRGVIVQSNGEFRLAE